ncbi:hypothetical protein I4F81_011388 [Pyropia yezoensis]|uniref:Uncharacterized protein n=1 Tax=Pyropia yezoensis TaxID=2788 RepID=A0ACC3CF67_PYRYE|nr:hypothetical protein I4F81_011388 [Neopyropia yezoensis]
MGVRRRTTTAARAAVAAVLTATIAASVASVHAALDLTVIVSDLVLSTLDLSSGSNAVYAAALMEENCLRRDSRAAAHEVLRFTTTIRNVGDSDLVIGLPPHDHSFSDANWEWGATHMHWHYAAYATYGLIDETGRDAGVGFTPSTSAQSVNGQKTGFCVEDSTNCPGKKFQCCNMGITAGCGDIYSNALTCEWIDVTGLDLSRRYTLKVTVNPGNRLGEANFANNVAVVNVDFARIARSSAYNLRAPAAMLYSSAIPVCKAWIDEDDALYPDAPINRVAFELNPLEELFNLLFPNEAVSTTAATPVPATVAPATPAPPALPTRTVCTFIFFCRQVPIEPSTPPVALPATASPSPSLSSSAVAASATFSLTAAPATAFPTAAAVTASPPTPLCVRGRALAAARRPRPHLRPRPRPRPRRPSRRPSLHQRRLR